MTSYAMIVGPHAISDGPTPRKIDDIRGGPSNKVMVAECAGAGIEWLEPRDLKAEDIKSFELDSGDRTKPPRGINSEHPGSANVLFCDGTVRTIHRPMDEKALGAILTIDGKAVEPQAVPHAQRKMTGRE